MNIIDEMANKAITDEYFIQLFNTAEKIYWQSILAPNLQTTIKYSKKELDDILTFADILSLSSTAEHRNLALKVISCLRCIYENDAKFNYYSKGIMLRLGNFPGYKLLTNNEQNTEDSLPLDISIEKAIKEQINKDPYSDKIFTDEQFQMLETLYDKNHFSFSGPTSFGKSFILTSYIKSLIVNNKRGLNIVFLVPTRALVSQTLKKFKSVVDGMEGYYLSASPDIPALFHNRNAHYLFVFTPERLLHYFSLNNPSIEYVFVDEAQKILSDDTRSVVYYHAISLAERKSCKLFFSSPNISNVDIFLRLFNKTSSEIKTVTESPVCQTRVFIDMLEKKVTCYSDLNVKVSFPYGQYRSLSDLICNISGNVNSTAPKSLIYCNTIEDTIECAKSMCRYLGNIKPSPVQLTAANELAGFIHKDYYLVEFIKHGVGFHFGKLPQKVRDIVEKLYERGEIHYLFCTSTLLEGVNLPAQNIFILNNQIGNKDLQGIDFWNLAGRAGRLNKELCGNVFCVRWIDKDGRWNTVSSRKVIENKKIESVSTDVITGKQNFYKNILCAAQGKPFTRKDVTETQRRVYNSYSNVLLSHYFDDQPSLLRNEFQKKEPNGVREILDIEKKVVVPSFIVSRFPLINVKYQNNIWNASSMFTPLLQEPTYDNCLLMLNCLCDLYHWETEESGGRNPLLPRGDKSFLKHYASLMSDWMNSKSINEIINQTLFNYRGKNISEGFLPSGKMNIVPFNPNNITHINIVINKTISEIDTVIRFTLKNYFENYYCILKSRDGEDNCGNDWALYMEHGTTKKELIEIQKLGVPRHLSKMFLDDFGTYCSFDNGEIVGINIKELGKKLLSSEKNEYSELQEALVDNYIISSKNLQM